MQHCATIVSSLKFAGNSAAIHIFLPVMAFRSSFFFKNIRLFSATLLATVLLELTFLSLSNKLSSLKSGKNKEVEMDRFQTDWCRMQNWRVDWEQMLSPCVDQMSWGKRKTKSVQRTDARRSYIKEWDINPIGQ